MTKYKFFNLTKIKEDEFNKFVENVDIAKDGIVFRGDYVVVSYFDKYDGWRPDDLIESLKGTLTAMQGDMLAWYIELTNLEEKRAWFDANPDAPKMNPSPSELNTKTEQMKQRIEDHKFKMASIRKLIENIKNKEVEI